MPDTDANGTKIFISLLALIITIIGATVAVVLSFESVRQDHKTILEKCR